MTEAMTVATPGALAWIEPTREQIDLLKRTIARGTSDDEFKLFLEACRRRRFDPFSKLIYPVKRYDSNARMEVMALQSSIDSFRLVAERTGKYEGQVGPFWCGPDKVWHDVWIEDDAPRASRVGVWRSGFKEPLWGVALWSNYVQATKQGDVTKFWRQMGPLMLAKCAESQALRRAFPEDLAGLYTSEEMAQVEPVSEHVEVDRRTGEVTSAAPAKLPERTQAPRTVDVQATKPEPVSAQPAASQEPQEIDWSAIPTYLDNGGMNCWGIPVSENTIKRWAWWKKDLAIDGTKNPKSGSCLKDKTWLWATEGSVAGQREQALQYVVKMGLVDISEGKPAGPWREKAAWALHLMYDERMRREQEAASNADFEQQTGIGIDPDGESLPPF